MDCSQVVLLFSAALDQDLNQTQQEAWHDHLATCPDCRDQWRSFRNTLAMVHKLESLPAPPELLPKILMTVAERPAASSWWGRLVDHWHYRDFSVSLTTAAVTLTAALFLAILLKGLFSPASLPDWQADRGVSEDSNIQLAEKRPQQAFVPGSALFKVARPRANHLAPSLTDPFSANLLLFQLLGLERPDVLVVFNNAGAEVLSNLFRQGFVRPNWQVTYLHREMLLLELPAKDLSSLRAMLLEHPVAIAPLVAFSSDFGGDKANIRVAISNQ